jgi:acetyl esterase/lipase
MTNFRISLRDAIAIFCLTLTSATLVAQMPQLPPILASTRPQLPGEIQLYPGTAPGSTPGAEAEQWDTMGGEYMARNVTIPTLIPVLPDPAKANGAAVLIAPGGAFMGLSMDSEGLNVARKLADRGVAAFVLKYRLDPTPRDIPGFMQAIGARVGAVSKDGSKGAPPLVEHLAIDDAATAMKLIRSRAAEWKIDPNRTGMIGFSAGAMTTLTLTLENRPGALPSFVGIIYGPMLRVTVPPQAPPLFAALASDDPLFGSQGFGLIDSWKAAGFPVEVHLYEHGGHGFGMHQQRTTSDLWFEEFFTWMQDGKLLEPTK